MEESPFSIRDLITFLRSCHSDERSRLIDEGGLLGKPYKKLEEDPVCAEYLSRAAQGDEASEDLWRRRAESRFADSFASYAARRTVTAPLHQQALLDPILKQCLAELREMPPEADAIAFVQEHLPEFCTLYPALDSSIFEVSHWPEINYLISLMREVERREPPFSLKDMNEYEIDYVRDQRDQEDFIAALTDTHPMYNARKRGVVDSVSSPVPASLYRQVPGLVNRLEALPPHQLKAFLEDNPDSAQLVNALVQAYDKGHITSGYVEVLRKLAMRYQFDALGTGIWQDALDDMGRSSPMDGLLGALRRETFEEYVQRTETPIQAMGARDIEWMRVVPASMTIFAEDLRDHGQEILQRFPTIQMIKVEGLNPGILEEILAIPEMRLVRQLDLSGNPLGNYSAQLLADTENLSGCANLKLRDCDIGASGAQALNQARSDGNLARIFELDLADNDALHHTAVALRRQSERRKESPNRTKGIS